MIPCIDSGTGSMLFTIVTGIPGTPVSTFRKIKL